MELVEEMFVCSTCDVAAYGTPAHKVHFISNVPLRYDDLVRRNDNRLQTANNGNRDHRRARAEYLALADELAL